MIDPIAASVDAIFRGDAVRLPLVALAGLVTSIGPCVAPRYIAISALATNGRRTLTIAAFIAGMLTAYAALGFGAGLLSEVAGHASVLYAVLAVALGAGGIATLARSPACVHEREPKGHRLSGVFSLGAASALVVSPCCTPVLAAVLGMSAVDGNPVSRAVLLAAFAAGHAAPLVAAGSLGSLFTRTFRTWHAGPATAVVSGSLMLALAAYYGVLV